MGWVMSPTGLRKGRKKIKNSAIVAAMLGAVLKGWVDMPVTVTDAVAGPYFPNGVTRDFPFAFKIAARDEISAYQEDATGAPVLVSPANFDVQLAVDTEGGTVRFAVPPAAGSGEIYLVSDPLFTQEVLFEDEGPFNSAVLNPISDRSAIRDIWLRDQLSRSLRVGFGRTAPEIARGVSGALAVVDGSIVVGTGGINIVDYGTNALIAAVVDDFGVDAPIDANVVDFGDN